MSVLSAIVTPCLGDAQEMAGELMSGFYNTMQLYYSKILHSFPYYG